MTNKTKKERFYELIKERGFNSFREFCRAAGVGPGNAYSNLADTFELSIGRAFVYAGILQVPIDTILEIFYPDEMRALDKLVNKSK